MIDAPVGRHPRQRQRMAVVGDGRPAATPYRVMERYRGYTLVEASPKTGGRTRSASTSPRSDTRWQATLPTGGAIRSSTASSSTPPSWRSGTRARGRPSSTGQSCRRTCGGSCNPSTRSRRKQLFGIEAHTTRSPRVAPMLDRRVSRGACDLAGACPPFDTPRRSVGALRASGGPPKGRGNGLGHVSTQPDDPE